MINFNEIHESIKDESDRGAVLVAASMLEFSLKELLKKRLIVCGKNSDPLFDNNGAISTFSSKIELCYRLGLISLEQRNMYDIFRRIRNKFAHNPQKITLDNESINSQLLETYNSNPNAKRMFSEKLSEDVHKDHHPDEAEAIIESIKNNTRSLFNILYSLEICLLNISIKQIERISG